MVGTSGKLLRFSILSASVSTLALATPAVAQQVRPFDIPAQPLSSALLEFSKQSDVMLVVAPGLTESKRSPAVKGTMPVNEAIGRLLRGSHLRAEANSRGGYVVSAEGNAPAAMAATPTNPSSLGQVEHSGKDIVVTGSRIRGANPTAPIRVLRRDDIERSGYSDVGDLVRSLPEDFSGGQNPGVIGVAGGTGNTNATNASTVNLRGLGTDATLTLVNGHRLPSDSYFQGSDISGIPFEALERVEILKDGASAIYGSDAVAGVVNFILRKDYNGVSAKARVGTSTEGGGTEQSYSLLAGKSGQRWFGMVNLEYMRRNALTADQRDFTSQMYGDATLLQPEKRKSAFASAGFKISDSVQISGEALFNDRASHGVGRTSNTAPIFRTDVHTKVYSVAATLQADLPRDWHLLVTASAGRSRNDTVQDIEITPTFSIPTKVQDRNRTSDLEATADGSLFDLPGGKVRLALGGGLRHEDFRELNLLAGRTNEEGSRKIAYLFAEAQVPLISDVNGRPGLRALEVNLAGRYEHYSDFGSTANPHAGIRYVPFNDLAIRATWGKSFKAPSFLQQYQQHAVYVFNAAAFGSTEPGTGLMTWGGRPDLKPERSKSWTTGLDFTPEKISSLKLSATYFHIRYTDRIVQPVAAYSRAAVDPNYLPFVVFDPSAALQQQLISAADVFYDFSSAGYDPSQVRLVVLNQYTNALSQTAQGLDFGYQQLFTLGKSELQAFANATWLRLRQQTSTAAPIETLSGKLNFAPRFKARAGATWSTGPWHATAILNYLGRSTDNLVTPSAGINAWTTVDANLEYRLNSGHGLASGLRISLSATNLFDADPPFARGAAANNVGQFYDSTNSSALGRFVALQVVKNW